MIVRMCYWLCCSLLVPFSDFYMSGCHINLWLTFLCGLKNCQIEHLVGQNPQVEIVKLAYTMYAGSK